MNNNLPAWAQWVQALGPVASAIATVIIGAIVAYIAWRQARTAREKLVLDLFDRRFAWYFSVRESLLKPLDADRATVSAAFVSLMRLHEEGKFLFNDSVLEGFPPALDDLMAWSIALEIDYDDEGEREPAVNRAKGIAIMTLTKLHGALPRQIESSLRMTYQLE
jgi:hypothetical protein